MEEQNRTIEVFLYGFHLGDLSFDEKTREYIYNSDLEEELKFCEIHYPQLEDYNLWGSTNVRTKSIPGVFKSQVESILNRTDLIELLKISESTPFFDILWELGKYYHDSSRFIALKSKNAEPKELFKGKI